MSDLGGTASRSTARTGGMRQRRRASRSSAHRPSTWAPFPYRGIPTTWPSRVPTKRRCTSSLAEQCTRSRCSQKGIRGGRNRRELAVALMALIELLWIANRALSQAKKHGRNRVEIVRSEDFFVGKETSVSSGAIGQAAPAVP